MSVKLLVFDSHPVQYRVPIWREIESLLPGGIHVVYASDCSVRGQKDEGFGQNIAWDEPMLAGYSNTILNCEKAKPLAGWSSLTGEGVKEQIEKTKPAAILLTGLNYKYDLVVYKEAKRRKIPVWLRCETQDQAMTRPVWKNLIRSSVYRLAYKGLSKAFYIGELNRQHYLKHGLNKTKLQPAFYCTVNRFEAFDHVQKANIRKLTRENAGIAADAIVIGFSGKFIPKKNPDILFDMLQHLDEAFRKRIVLYFIGSGELENDLKQKSKEALMNDDVKTFFAGFVNQSQLAPHYLTMDILVLPSRRMGETWGLVANEAMQAGCSVVVSNAVGCSVDFAAWQRFNVFPEGNASALAGKITDLAQHKRDFDWASQDLKLYSIEAAANALAKALYNKN